MWVGTVKYPCWKEQFINLMGLSPTRTQGKDIRIFTCLFTFTARIFNNSLGLFIRTNWLFCRLDGFSSSEAIEYSTVWTIAVSNRLFDRLSLLLLLLLLLFLAVVVYSRSELNIIDDRISRTVKKNLWRWPRQYCLFIKTCLITSQLLRPAHFPLLEQHK